MENQEIDHIEATREHLLSGSFIEAFKQMGFFIFSRLILKRKLLNT
jgi:hypothetical protein